MNALREALLKDSFFSEFEIISGYQDLLISTRSWAGIDWVKLEEKLHAVIENCQYSQRSERAVIDVPVCYDEEYALDLISITEQTKLSAEEVIQLHSESTYFVHFIGFTIGFPFLSGLAKELILPRKATPRIHVPKGSVAIAGEQAGIYSVDSAGGWNILGKTPLSLFDVQREKICRSQAGDRVRFYSITKTEFHKMS